MKKLLLLSHFLFLTSYFSFSQNVGIGTASPASKLHVKGTGIGTQILLEENAGTMLRISNEATAIGPYIGTTSNHPLTLVANNAGRMTILPNGNIGIGTSSPEQLFSVAGGMVVDQNNLNNGTPTTMLRFGSFSGEGVGSRRTAGTNQYGLDLYTQNINRMTITNGGNVGIGLINPSAKLEIRGALGFSSTTKRWEMNYDSTAGYFYIDEFGSGRRLFVKNGGNVGINNSNPQSTLDINGTLNVSSRILINNDAGTDGQVLTSGGPAGTASWTNTSYTTIDRFLYLSTSLNLAINTTFSDTVLFGPRYELSGAISYNSTNGVFTINKTGLYQLTGSFNPILGGPNNNGANSSLALRVGIFTYIIGRGTFLTVLSSSSYIGSGNLPVDLQLYFTAGSTFCVVGSVVADGTVNFAGFGGDLLSIVLIAE